VTGNNTNKNRGIFKVAKKYNCYVFDNLKKRDGDSMKTDIKLFTNVDTGEGTMKVMPHFEKMNTLWQLDALRDWIWDLQNLYNKKVDVWEKELKAVEETTEEDQIAPI